MTTLVHCKEPHDIYIGRPSKWGNPYSHVAHAKIDPKFLVATRKEAVAKFEIYLRNNSELMACIQELEGKVLGCWCKPGQLCHGSIYIKVLEGIKIKLVGLWGK